MPYTISPSRVRPVSNPVTYSGLIHWLNQQPDGMYFNRPTGLMSRNSFITSYNSRYHLSSRVRWEFSVFNKYLEMQARADNYLVRNNRSTNRTYSSYSPYRYGYVYVVSGFQSALESNSPFPDSFVMNIHISTTPYDFSGRSKMARVLTALTIASYFNTIPLTCHQVKQLILSLDNTTRLPVQLLGIANRITSLNRIGVALSDYQRSLRNLATDMHNPRSSVISMIGRMRLTYQPSRVTGRVSASSNGTQFEQSLHRIINYNTFSSANSSTINVGPYTTRS